MSNAAPPDQLAQTFDKQKLYDALGYEVHHEQVARFHNSKARIKVCCAPARTTKSYSAAHDVIPDIITRRGRDSCRVWIVGPCVDTETECLTKRGWLKHYELKVGDAILSLDDEGLAEWNKCQKIHSKIVEGDMVRINMRGHDSLTTINHRWLVGYTGSNGNKRKNLGYRFNHTATLTKPNEYILTSAPVTDLNKIKTYSDGFVETVAWYWTEGHNQAVGNGVIISQNIERSEQINSAATRWLGTPVEHMKRQRQTEPLWVAWKEMKYSPSEKSFKSQNPRRGVVRFNSIAGVKIKEAAPNKTPSMEFINLLTLDQLKLFINVSVNADGHERIRIKPSGAKCRERVIIQKNKQPLDSMQMVAQLAGYQSTLKLDKRGMWVLNIFNRNKIWPGQKPQLEKRTSEYYYGTIWCPQTSNGTWLARRNGNVYFTGNSYELAEKEFRYIYDALVLKLGMKPTYARTNARSGKPMLEFAGKRVIEAKSAENPNQLLGE